MAQTHAHDSGALKKGLLPFLYCATVAYMFFTAFCLHWLGETTELLYQNPFIVTNEATQMRMRLGEVSRTLPILMGRAGMSEDEVISYLREQEGLQDAAAARMREKFRGRVSQLNSLITALDELRQVRTAFVNANLGMENAAEMERKYNRIVAPKFRVVDILLAEITAGAEKRAVALVEEMSRVRTAALLVTFVVGVMILLLIMYIHRLEAARIAAAAYQERLFRLLGENIDEVFLIADAAGVLDYVSVNSKRILGIPADKLAKEPMLLYTLFESPVGEWLRERVLLAHNRYPSERDITLYPAEEANQELHSPSSARFFKVRIYPVWVDDVFQRTIVVLYDQTKAIRSQQALNDALQNARMANSAKSSFLSHMSHEIRTPMNAIIGMTSIALSHMNSPERVEDCLGKIALSSRHLLGLINDVLDMAKIEEGKLSINREPFDLKEALRSLATIVMPQVEARGLNFDILVQDGVVENLEGDALRLNQILLNLLSNSIKFTPEGGSVVLEVGQILARDLSVRLQFIVSDTGIGMDKETLERLYQPFEQGSAGTAARFGGTGLGMAITQNLITLLGGTIQVESEEGKGTVFTVELPFWVHEGATVEMHTGLGALKVLVVDDDQGTCEHAALLLDKLGMIESWTLNGKDALLKLHEAHDRGEDYDICVIDWKMPDMDGKELARRIREEIGASQIILILASAYDYSVIEDEARSVGVDAFIPKPFFASSLYNILCKVCHRAVVRQGISSPAGFDGPAEDGSAPDSAPAESGSLAERGKPRYDFSAYRVLLAEDNEFNKEIACEFLAIVGATVDVADNGRQAVDKYLASPPGTYACILMDVQMPEMDGHEAARAIRSLSRADARTIPIIAMTANAFDDDVAAAFAAGMSAHLAKPLDVQAMYRLMDEKIRESRGESAA